MNLAGKPWTGSLRSAEHASKAATAGHGGGLLLFLPSQHCYVTGGLRLYVLVFIHWSWIRGWRVVM